MFMMHLIQILVNGLFYTLNLCHLFSTFSGILYRVTPYIDQCFILLTYKGKVLLLQQDNILPTPNTNEWRFINKLIKKNTTAEKAILQEVYRETNVELENVNLLSSMQMDETMLHVFHGKLSDKHVNNIQRAEGRNLQFFSLKELQKLHMHPSTQIFFKNNWQTVESLSAL